MGDEVSPVELLFDLVFAFALSQLSHHLLEHLSWGGALETAVLLMAVFGIWKVTSFGASMPGVNRRAAVGALLAVLVLGLFFNAGIPRAFETAPWLFFVPFLICNIGVIFLYMFADSSPLMRQHGRSMLVWAVPSTALWLAGAFAAPGSAGLGSAELGNRVWWWLAAALLDLVGAWSAHRLPWRRFRTAEVPFAPEHMIERSRAFLIILLGETILTTGGALSGVRIDAVTILSGCLAVAGTVALWALYFAGSDRLVADHATRTADPLRAARLAINGQIVTAAGLIVVAVGYEMTIQRPLTPAGTAFALLLFGGPLLYVALQTWYLRALTGKFSRSRLAGVVVLIVMGAVAWALPAVVALAASSLVLGLLALRVAVESRRNPVMPAR
jgi:low temperature requirement protein LtrA